MSPKVAVTAEPCRGSCIAVSVTVDLEHPKETKRKELNNLITLNALQQKPPTERACFLKKKVKNRNAGFASNSVSLPNSHPALAQRNPSSANSGEDVKTQHLFTSVPQCCCYSFRAISTLKVDPVSTSINPATWE